MSKGVGNSVEYFGRQRILSQISVPLNTYKQLVYVYILKYAIKVQDKKKLYHRHHILQ